jgi:hypothetical protein
MNRKIIILLSMITLTGALVATSVVMRTSERFKRLIENNKFVIAYFYKRTAGGRDCIVEKNLQTMRKEILDKKGPIFSFFKVAFKNQE